MRKGVKEYIDNTKNKSLLITENRNENCKQLYEMYIKCKNNSNSCDMQYDDYLHCIQMKWFSEDISKCSDESRHICLK